MDELEKELKRYHIENSCDIDNRNKLLKNIRNCINEINTKLNFFAMEPTFLYGFGFKTRNGRIYKYELVVEDDRFVEYKFIIEKEGDDQISIDYSGKYLDLCSDDGLQKILKKIEGFISDFKNNKLEQNYEIVW